MTFLIDWAKSIVYYVLFIKVITSLMPSGNMAKYFKLFSGVLLIIILIQPLIQLKSFDKNIFTHIVKIENELDQKKITKQSRTYEQLNSELTLDLYVKNTRERIISIVRNSEVYVASVNLKVNDDQKSDRYGEILEINLVVYKKTKKTKDLPLIADIEISISKEHLLPKSEEDILIEKNIKSDLLDFYNLNADNIHISIENN